ncbi:transporter substrate-binding domain-containing protein [Streptococcus sp. DD13]|uniref:transporter substrate-binding domain-containing protein n=1 Tax=Streptococcus sp. DD13 TaxID=1777881 RepID=UPI0008359596|nr:transporter substrate-binding domain-containing protein [Streptococcus sp. DD13]
MKKIFALATTAVLAGLALAACSSTSSNTDALKNIQEKKKLVVATSPDYAPFEFKTMIDGKDQTVGADILLAQKIADELGVELEVEELSFDNVLAAVQSKKADIAIAGLTVTDQRKKSFDFSESYYDISDAVLIKKTDLDKLTTVDALKKAKIAVQTGTTQETNAKEDLSGASITSISDMSEAVSELKAGKVEAVVMDKIVAQGFVDNNSDLALATVELPTHANNSKAIALPKNSGDLKEKIDEIIKKLKASGEYDKYIEQAKAYSVSSNESK